jgi:hypothetical protein
MNAAATAAAQAGRRDRRLTRDQICRVTANLHVAVCEAAEPAGRQERASRLKRLSITT